MIEPTDLDTALQAADAGSAGHWPTVAGVLADEVRDLQKRLADAVKAYDMEVHSHGLTIEQRDHVENVADDLAAAIAPADVLGEHSTGNDPWRNALDYAAGRAAALSRVGIAR
jgi:hypothetical protein